MQLIHRVLFTGIILFTVSNVFTEDYPRVEMFSPQGVVKGVRQVTARFSEQMVPFGDPRANVSPFEMDCSFKGTGRWADTKNWVFDFDGNLPAGMRCTFRLRPDLKTLAGKELKGQDKFTFSTGGPSVIRSNPYQGSAHIDEEQIFILYLDAEPDKTSVEKNAAFSVEGIQDYIGIRIIDGKERDEILKSQWGLRTRLMQPVILIQCKQTFPSGAKVSLVWSRNIESATGVANLNDQVLRYKARPAFNADFHCDRENAKANCIPILPMTLRFSAPVSKSLAGKIILKGKDGKIWRPELSNDEDNDNAVNGVYFKGPFTENSAFKIELPGNFIDDSGRRLVNADDFPLAVRTDKYPPLAKFSARFGILELKADPVLPVTLRNIEPEIKAKILHVGKEGFIGNLIGKVLNVSSKGESIQEWLRRAGNAERSKSVFTGEKSAKEFRIPRSSGAAAFEVVGIPLKEPGFYVVELESEILGSSLLGRQSPMYVPTSVLVTNLSVHFKWGRESSLIWVTALNTGEPVKDAEVAVKDCADKILWHGKTNSNGIVKIDSALPSLNDIPDCRYNSIGSGYFITAKLGSDMSFVFSSWDEGIEPWRFQLPQDYYSDPTIARTIFDRTLLRAGETVHMKHVIRQHTMSGFLVPARDKLPNLLVIAHYGSSEKYEFPLAWDIYGTAETSFAIPKDAKLGTYGLTFQSGSSKSGRRAYYNRQLSGGEFRVEEFRIPLLKGSIIPPRDPQINAKSLTLDINVRYLAGGGAGNLPAKLRSNIQYKTPPAFEGYDEFVFATGSVKEGIERSGQAMDEEAENEESGSEESAQKSGKIPAIDLTLDKFGGTRVTIPDLPGADHPQEILAELEYRDPNGELQTVSSGIPLWPSKYVIGIKPDSWALSKDNFKFHTVVLDLTGKPVAGAPVKIYMFTKKTYSHRKRLVGGFYAYEYTTEVKKAAAVCEGKTDSIGLLICGMKSPVSGEVILQAESEDKDGNKTVANRGLWVAGQGEWWFEVSDNDRIDLLPEKKRYEPGETAVFQVRMPFRNATALVTVEREGIMESWIKKLSGKQPVIEVPVRGTYAPNCFVSVLAVRGRISGVQPTAMADMGRPSYKLGISEIKVGWKEHELKVSVTPERRVYKIREKARVRIKVKTSDGKTPPPGTEAAVAAVDEGLLELMPNQSWNILPAMMGQRPYEVKTATAQMQVIGRRHFGLKALPQGGGGGRQTTRELFDTLLLWKGRVKLDNKGEAIIEIPLNDSITSFRIAAVVTAGTSFGTGTASIQSTQDLMILAGLPPVVREGDLFKAEFTLRNTTGRPMVLEASANAEGIAGSLKPEELILQPGEAKEIGWNIYVPVGIDKLAWTAEVKEKNGAKDSIKIGQKVVPAVPVSAFQATIAQIEKKYLLAIERPKNAIPGRGGVRVTLKPKLSGAQPGITDYMKNYPYSCLEQKISVAVALRDKNKWEDIVAGISSYIDPDGFAKYFPTSLYGSPVLTSYIIAIANEAEWNLPQDAESRMKKALNKFIEGSVTRHSQIRTADLAIRKLSAIEALSRSGEAQPKLLDSISIEPNLWPASAVIDWFNILHNIKNIPDREKKIKEAEQILRSRLNFQGTKMGFSSEGSDFLWWLMVSNDVNSVRLVLSLIHAGKWKEDMPRIVGGALARQHRGRWDLTPANAWGVLALEKFSQLYEAVAVSGETRTVLADESQTTDWSAAPKGKSSLFAWPSGKNDLSISHMGGGRPWATVQSLAAIPLNEPISSGYRIRKTVRAIEQKNPGRWTRGDIYRVRLDLEAQADQTWVVVSDPVPAGSTILGKGLARDSQILTKDEERKGWVWPAYEERSFEAFRAYYEFVPKGKWTVEYTIRVNQSGKFHMPTTRVEALYFPEMFGEIPNGVIEVVR